MSARGEGIVAFIKERRRELEVAGFVHEAAAQRVASEGVPGMDEGRLFLEWVNDVLADPDPDAWQVASSDPATAYGTFLDRRLADPYHVSYRAVRALERRVGAWDANKFVHLHWNQEVAWAQRLRTSECRRTAVLSHLFLLRAGNDTCKWFTELAQAWEAAWAKAEFAQSPSHGLTEYAIREGDCVPAHVPAYLSLFDTLKGDEIDKMGETKLAAAAVGVARIEVARARGALASRAAAVARRTPLARILGIIGVAHSTSRDAATLWADERRFLVDVEQGRVACATAGLPYTEFVNWLRVTKPCDHPGEPPPGHAARHALQGVLIRPSAWLSTLPADYTEAGASDAACFNGWIRPIAAGEAPVPWDMAASYGFHLFLRSFRH